MAANAHLPRGVYLHGKQHFYYARDPQTGRQHRVRIGEALPPGFTLMPPQDYAKVSVARSLLRNIRKNAPKRGLSVALTVEDVLTLLRRAGGRCEVTGIVMREDRHAGMRVRPWYPSVDRIDRRVGYVPENCRVVCTYANIALNEFGEDFFAFLASSFRVKRQRAVDLFPNRRLDISNDPEGERK